MLTPKEVSGKTFDKTFGFGYRMDDVDAYLQKVADSMTELMEINSDLEKKLEVLADKLNEYREDEESLRTAILGAQKLGDSVIRESKTKAEIITRDATCKAEAMVNNAKRQIEREQENLLRTQREVANFKNRLLDMYKSHIELISMIPGDIEEEEQPEEIKEVQSEEVINEQPSPETISGSDDRETTVEDIDVDEDEMPKLTPPEQYFGIDLDDDDDEEDETETPSKHGEMRFGDAFRIKHKSTQHKFRK
ncbi:MAG: DivIVA domain-containing protein [Clostridia bacterium]|nr:DivIVA domain-containing protein [Clostridia bacterium]